MRVRGKGEGEGVGTLRARTEMDLSNRFSMGMPPVETSIIKMQAPDDMFLIFRMCVPSTSRFVTIRPSHGPSDGPSDSIRHDDPSDRVTKRVAASSDMTGMIHIP